MARQKKSVKKAPKKRSPSENEIHMKCFQWVSKTYPELLIFHVANELQAHVSYHLKQKRLGKLNGVADFLAFPISRKIAIEMKDGDGVQEPDQERFQKRWERIGGEYFIIRTVDDFKTLVTAFMVFG